MIHGHVTGTAMLAYAEKRRNTQATSTPSLFLIFQVKRVRKKITCEYNHVSSLLAHLCSKPFLFCTSLMRKLGQGQKRAMIGEYI